MTARGGLDLGGDRTEIAPRGTISKSNVYGHEALGFSKWGQRSLRRCIRFAIDDILGLARPLCLHDPERLRRAVVYAEDLTTGSHRVTQAGGRALFCRRA